MANWTVSSWSNTETTGDNVTAGSMAAYVDLVITPNVGYVISANRFKIGGATESPTNTWTGGNVDSEIYKVVFSDIGTVNSIANTVRARVHFAAAATGGSSWSMPANNDTLYIDIDEKEEVTNVDRPFCIRSHHIAEADNDGINRHTVTYATAPTNITTTNNTPLVHNVGNGLVEHGTEGTVVDNPTYPGAQVIQVTFATNTLYGYYYINTPTFALSGNNSSYYEVIDSSHTYTSMITGGITANELTSVVFTVYYTPPNSTTDPDMGNMCELGQVVLFNHSIRQEDQGEPGSTPMVKSVDVLSTDILSTGENRDVTVYGDVGAEFSLQIISSDSSKTYDFTTDTFTAGATTSAASTISGNGHIVFPIVFPAASANTTYDIIIIPTAPTIAASGVPIAATDLRLYQYVSINMSIGINDSAGVWGEGTASGDIFESGENTVVTITGEAGRTLTDGIRKTFSYTIKPAYLDAGSGTLTPKTTLDFTLDNEGSVTTLTDGAASSATHDVDSTSGIVAGNTINWSVDKTPLFKLESVQEIQVGEAGQDATLEIPPNIDNLTVGMILSAPNIRSERGVTITSIGTSSIIISEEITVDPKVDITFTADGVTVSSVTDGNTLVASQSLNLTDNLSLDFGGTTTDASAYIINGASTQSSANVIITGTFIVDSFPTADQTVKIDINELITIS